MTEKIIKIQANGGLHLRVASEIINISKNCSSKILLECPNCPNKTADGCSLLELLFLEATYGQYMHIAVDGRDENFVLNKIETILTKKDANETNHYFKRKN